MKLLELLAYLQIKMAIETILAYMHLTICSQTPHSLSEGTRCPGLRILLKSVMIGHLKALGCREHETLYESAC